MKKTVLLSLVAGALIFAGCGGGGSNDTSTNPEAGQDQNQTQQADTTPPVITNGLAYSVEENSDKNVTLTANEDVNFSMVAKQNFALSGNILTFSAPEYNATAGAINEYNTTVTATDLAGNESNATFVFTVTKRQVNANVEIVPLGDKALTLTDDGRVVGPTGLIWDDVKDRSNIGKTYTEAEQACQGNKRLPFANELLNILNFEKATDPARTTMLEDEFQNPENITEFWAQTQGGKQFYVNVKHGGVSVEDNATAVHAVKCVEGDPAAAHTVTDEGNGVYLDDDTQLEWQKLDQKMTVADMQNACQDPWRLPNINELRSLINPDGSLLTADMNIIPGLMWSNTEFVDINTTNKRNFVVKATEEPLYVNVEPQDQSYYVLCVKEK